MPILQKPKPVVILGAGVSGLMAAITLLEAGYQVVVVEKAPQVGGAAASVPIPENRRVPAGYHQIVGSDHHLVSTLTELGLIDQVQWKRTTISSQVDGKRTNLASPIDMLQFTRLSLVSRFRYFLFGVRCLLTKNWSAWKNRSVSELLKTWANTEVLDQIFRPLIDIKFGFSPDLADAAWLGQRLSHGEGATPFGYIPNASWTEVMIKSLVEKIESLGGKVLVETSVTGIVLNQQQRVERIKTSKGSFKTQAVISTLPPPVLVSLLASAKAPQKWLKPLTKIKYIAAYSLLAGLSVEPFPDYWTIFLHPRRIFGGCFTLSVLNDTLRTKKDRAVINLFTNIPAGEKPWQPEEYQQLCLKDLQSATGLKLKFNWVRTHYIPWVSPVFDTTYQNPPMKLGKNLYLAGIYRTYPRLSSTGEAMADGKDVALKMISDKV